MLSRRRDDERSERRAVDRVEEVDGRTQRGGKCQLHFIARSERQRKSPNNNNGRLTDDPFPVCSEFVTRLK